MNRFWWTCINVSWVPPTQQEKRQEDRTVAYIRGSFVLGHDASLQQRYVLNTASRKKTTNTVPETHVRQIWFLLIRLAAHVRGPSIHRAESLV